MTKQAMQQALEALEALHGRLDGNPHLASYYLYDSFYREVAESAISSLREAMENGDAATPQQPAQAHASAANSVMRTAPARIWLNLFDTPVDTDGERLFPEDHEGVTWAEDEVGDYDVQYIRADLASPQQGEG